ncbi:flocculation protein FLO11-like [Phragmites australis]|uniref:flocculation protein FLO11-like n=1 Tax=Phragmites australis TaxID=29695 RepID=UPI002D797AE4|nr:flocculation protein FLO11-like [Phragmites australis]
MSTSAARSPSPGPAARPCCGLRRSTDSSPFRPIVSTPDSPQRSSSVCKTGGGGRASSRAWCAEKENDNQRDGAKTPKARSIAGGGVGVAKSFMAPTISASSKAVAASASPRKKVLGERNNDDLPQQLQGEIAHNKPRDAPTPVPEAQEEERVENPACKIHHHQHQAARDAAASADADPAAPYDPKTNYLSPRPRFLRYKPKPRVEQYRQGGASVRRLEDGFVSESSEESDTVTTTEEDGLTEEEQEQLPSSVPNDFPEESLALDAMSEARAEPAAPAVACVLSPQPTPFSPLARVLTPELEEPSPTSPRARVPTPEPEPAASPARARAKKKMRSSLRFLIASPLALVLFMTTAFVCVPPSPGSPVILNTSLSKVSDFLSVQELHPVELAAWLKQWSSSSLDFVASYWKALASSQEEECFGPHFAANLSAAAADHGIGFYYSAAETRPMPTEQEPISASVLEQEFEILEVVSASDTDVIAESDVEEMANFGDAAVEEPIDDAEMDEEAISAIPSFIEEANEYVDAEVEEEIDAEMSEEVPGSIGEEMASHTLNLDIPSQSAPEPEHVEDMDESSLQKNVQTDESEGDRADGKEDQESHHGLKLGSNMWPYYLDEISNPAAIGAALAAIIVPAALAFLYMRQKQARVELNSNEPAEQVEQVETQSGSGSSEGHVFVKDSQSPYPMIEETERFGDSGASQYSSSLSSGLDRRRNDKGEESLNPEPMSRRDSMAYSTSSYGSFTTYEKISAKKKNKEDEAITPVRRSSRLRNQVKSPEA